MKKLFVFLIAVLTLALTGCGGDAPKKDAAAPAGGDKQVLNLFSWADNFDPEVIAEFERQNNCKVNYDVFANNEELLAKIQAGGAQYRPHPALRLHGSNYAETEPSGRAGS